MDKSISIFQQRMILFFIGAMGYSIIEVAFRGYTHWTMMLTGGVVFSLLYSIQMHISHRPLWYRCLMGALVITAAEFLVGCVVNLWLGWEVWDYSMFQFQLLGQVCLVFSFLWFLLCAPIFFLSKVIHKSWP